MRHNPLTKADLIPEDGVQPVLTDTVNSIVGPDGVSIVPMLSDAPPALPGGKEACPVPGCSRWVLPSQLVHVANCPPAAFGGAEYACDGCRSTAILTGAITPEAFVFYTGGTSEAIARAAARTIREREEGNLPAEATVDLPSNFEQLLGGGLL
jgi:hypothetical protein